MKNKDEIIPIILITLLIILGYLFYTTAIFKIQPPSMVEKPSIERFLWTYRGLDILAQSFLVFIAAIAIASLFRVEKKGGERK